MTLSQRLLAGSLLVVGVMSALVVWLAGSRLEGRLRTSAIDDLTREARLVAAQWRPGIDADSLADSTSHWLHRRVTLIDDSGRVIGDSEFDDDALRALQNHNARAEVIEARRNGTGWSRRVSASAGDEEFYVAVRAPLGVARLSMSTSTLLETVSGARRDVLVAAGVAMLIAFALTVLFARQVTLPIVALRDVAKRIAEGDLSQRPQLSAAGEIGDLANALSRMAELLGARMGAMEANDALMATLFDSLNEGVLFVDGNTTIVRTNQSAQRLLDLKPAVDGKLTAITSLPRDRTLREAIDHALAGDATDPFESIVNGRTLAITAKPLRSGGALVALFDLTPFRQLEHIRRDFVANVSHELRTPLTVVRGFAETLADSEELPPLERQFARSISDNTVRMQRIVDDLLDLSRIESGGWIPDPRPVLIAPIAEEVLSTLRDEAITRGIRLEFEGPPDSEVFADPTALRQILTNLVSNALRHTQSGSVNIVAHADGDAIAIGVRDTGVGIASEHLPRLFERFYRVDAGRSRAQGGTGLGLAIVKHLVEAHGGTVAVESSVGVGTTVLARFPMQERS